MAFIGIGSNLGDPFSNVQNAISHLDKIPHSRLAGHSSLYQTEPVSDIPQDDYVNAVASIETSLAATELLAELQKIEVVFLRKRDPALKWAPRTLDLDIILYGNQRIDDSKLTVPHPEMSRRLFVLQPLLELAGDIDIPGLGHLKQLVKNAPVMEIDKIDA